MKYPFLSETTGGIRLALHIQPNSAKNEVVGIHQDRLKIKIRAVPTDGRANAEVILFLSEVFEVPKSSVEIISGNSGRNKFVAIAGSTISQALQTLSMLIAPAGALDQPEQ
jgi:uncharacterized protein (TIGR00251 family)